MPVQIPRIEATQPSAPNSVGRMEVSVPNMAQATAPLAEGIQKGTSKVIDAFEARQNEIAKQRTSQLDFKSTEEENAFALWSKQKRAEINLKEGDTTKDWIEYDKEAEERYKQVYSKYENMDADFKQLLDNKLNTAYRKEQTFRNIEQAEQNYKWKASVADNKVKLEQDSFFNSGTRLDINDLKTFENLKTFASAIVATRLAHAEQTGQLTYKEDGTPDFETGPVSIVIRKDIGDAVIPLVKTLNATGKVAEGKKVIEEYSKYLNAADRAKLMSDNDEADVSNQAIVKLTQLQQQVAAANPNNPSRRVMLSDIDKLKDLSPAVRFKLIEKNDIYNKRQDAEQGRQLDVLISSQFENLLKRQASPEAYVSEEEFVNSPEGKNVLEQVSKFGGKPSDVNNLRSLVVAPTKSKKAALEAYNDAVVNRTLGKMTPRELSEIYSNLNKQDRSNLMEDRRIQIYDQQRVKKVEGPATGDKISGMHGRMTKALEQQMKSYRDPKSGKLFFPTNKKEKFEQEYDTQMLTDYMSLVREDILRAGGKLTGAQENDIVNRRLAEMVEKRKKDYSGILSGLLGVEYKPSPREARPTSTMRPSTGSYGGRNSSPLAPVPTVESAPTSTPSTTVKPPKSDRKAWIKLYEEFKGSKFDAGTDMTGFKKFMKDN